MRVLITAATRHEATGEIAAAIGSGLAERGVDTETRPIDEVTDLAGYDAVVLGSAVYLGRWLEPARHFAEHHCTALAAIPVWLFSSGPLGPPAHLVPEGVPADITKLVKLTGAREHRVFAGRSNANSWGSRKELPSKPCTPPEATAETGAQSTVSPARSPHSWPLARPKAAKGQ